MSVMRMVALATDGAIVDEVHAIRRCWAASGTRDGHIEMAKNEIAFTRAVRRRVERIAGLLYQSASTIRTSPTPPRR